LAKTSNHSTFPIFECGRKTKPPLSSLKRFHEKSELREQYGPLIKVPRLIDPEAKDELHFRLNMLPANENHTQANHTIYESQYEVLVSQTNTKPQESSIGMESPQQSGHTHRIPKKLTGPCFLNMIDPFQINKNQMKLLTRGLQNTEFKDLKKEVQKLKHVF
jgi:hypothetical protein